MENNKIMAAYQELEDAMYAMKVWMFKALTEDKNASQMDYEVFMRMIGVATASLDLMKAQSEALDEIQKKLDILMQSK